MIRGGIEGGSFNPHRGESSSSEDRHANQPERIVRTFGIPTAETSAQRIERAEKAITAAEALATLTKIAEVKIQATEILRAVGKTSNAVNTVVGAVAKVAEEMVISSVASTMERVEDAGEAYSLARSYAERTLFDSSHQTSTRNPFAQELEAIPSASTSEPEPNAFRMSIRGKKNSDKEEYPERTRENVVKKAGNVARIGADVDSKAREAYGKAVEAGEVAEKANINARKIYESNGGSDISYLPSVTEEEIIIIITPAQEEIPSIKAVKDSVVGAENAVSIAEDVAVGAVFGAIDAVKEADSIIQAPSIEEAKGVITKVAAKLFTKAESKAYAAVHAAVDAEAKAAGYTVEANEKADGYIAGYTAAIEEARVGRYTPEYAETVKALARVAECTAAYEKAAEAGHTAEAERTKAEKTAAENAAINAYETAVETVTRRSAVVEKAAEAAARHRATAAVEAREKAAEAAREEQARAVWHRMYTASKHSRSEAEAAREKEVWDRMQTAGEAREKAARLEAFYTKAAEAKAAEAEAGYTETKAYVERKVKGYIEAVGYSYPVEESAPANHAATRRAATYSYKLAVTAARARDDKLFSSN